MLSIADAHQRDPQAIAEIIRQELQILGADRCDIEIAIIDSSLDLQIRTNSTIDREKLLTLLRIQLHNLRIESVAKVRVHCWRNDEETHEQHLLWTEQMMLEPLTSSAAMQALELESEHLGSAELQGLETRSSEMLLAESQSTEIQLSKNSVLQKAINKLSSNSPNAKKHLQASEKFAQSSTNDQGLVQNPIHQDNPQTIPPSTQEKYYWQLLLVGLSIVLLGLGLGAFFRSISIKNTVDSALPISSVDSPSSKSPSQSPQIIKNQDSDRVVPPKSSESPLKQNLNTSPDKVVIPSADNADLLNNPANISPSSNASPPEGKTITLEKFNLVQKGMTIEQVDKIFGVSGKVIAENTTNESIGRVYSWKNPQGSNAIIEFKDGQVVAKAQAGL